MDHQGPTKYYCITPSRSVPSFHSQEYEFFTDLNQTIGKFVIYLCGRCFRIVASVKGKSDGFVWVSSLSSHCFPSFWHKNRTFIVYLVHENDVLKIQKKRYSYLGTRINVYCTLRVIITNMILIYTYRPIPFEELLSHFGKSFLPNA